MITYNEKTLRKNNNHSKKRPETVLFHRFLHFLYLESKDEITFFFVVTCIIVYCQFLENCKEVIGFPSEKLYQSNMYLNIDTLANNNKKF